MASFSAGPGTGRYRRICMLVLAVVLSLLSAGCSTAPQGHDTAGIPRPDRDGLAVLNFKNTTARDQASQFQPWEYGIATMLSTDLEALGVFNIVERERLRDIVREYELQKSDLVDKDTVVKLGRLTAAKYILTGSFAEMNGELRIAVQIFS
ncbi:MAG TPA: CsgG/HfaB family protein, partial [Desulfomonilia bacterium]|nr:CsgG/HfaB family protein [Desulfomonilia bacterium]